MANLLEGREPRMCHAIYDELNLFVFMVFSLAAVVLPQSQAAAEPILTRVNDPVFTPVDFIQFSTRARSPAEGDAVFASVFSDHQTFIDAEFRLGPGEPHGPPYETEASLGAENAGFIVKDVFSLEEFTQPNVIFFMFQIVANEDAPSGPSPDSPNGRVIPNDVFPITWTRGIVKDEQFIQGPQKIQISSLSDEDMANDVDGNAEDFTGLNWSHIPFVSNHFVFPDFPADLALGDYEWRDSFRDASDNGWDIVVPYTITTKDVLDDLQPGDADQDLDFDQRDLVQVQVAAKYLSGEGVTWGEGDWNGAPGGSRGSPPAGDGLFDQLDVIAALGAGVYLTGPYGAIQPHGRLSDVQTSVVYDAGTGELSVDSPAGTELTSINIDSAAGIFTGESAQNLSGSFDNDADGNIFKATFGGSFGSLSFGNVASTGLSEEFIVNDLSVVGSLAGGGDLGNVDLVYVPEPTSILLLTVGSLICLLPFRCASR